MKIVKYIILEILFLIAMLLCGTVVMKVLDVLFQLNYENTWLIGYKVGFIAWLGLSIMSVINKRKKIVEKEDEL